MIIINYMADIRDGLVEMINFCSGQIYKENYAILIKWLNLSSLINIHSSQFMNEGTDSRKFIEV